MFKRNREKKPKLTYGKISGISKIASPILKALYYAAIVAAVLVGIVALIMLFVNVPVDEMLLPPYMSETDSGYSIAIGNGIRIDTPKEDVTLGDIKTVVYAELMLFAASLCIFAPICLFLSKISKNLASDGLYNMKNGRYMMYVGITVAVGYSFVSVVRDFYNYLLVKTYTPVPEAVHLSLRPELGGIFAGLVIIIFACVYSAACERYFLDANIPEKGSTDITSV